LSLTYATANSVHMSIPALSDMDKFYAEFAFRIKWQFNNTIVKLQLTFAFRIKWQFNNTIVKLQLTFSIWLYLLDQELMI